MKVVLFCAGQGTRIREYSEDIPKPMVPIGGRPILAHLMDYYGQFGHNDFVLCLGYKADVISNYFGAVPPACDSETACPSARIVQDDGRSVTLVDTGVFHNIGQRLWAVREQVQDDEMFLANYSDGLTDLDLDKVIEFFRQSGKVACFVAVRPPLTFHVVDVAKGGTVRSIAEASRSEIWINGGYFVFKPEIFDYMREGEELVVEPFQRLIAADQLVAYKHEGFWQAMDTVRDRTILENMIGQGRMPWRTKKVAMPAKELVAAI